MTAAFGHHRTRGVTILSNFLSGLLETDAIVLHSNGRKWAQIANHQDATAWSPDRMNRIFKIGKTLTRRPRRVQMPASSMIINQSISWNDVAQASTPASEGGVSPPGFPKAPGRCFNPQPGRTALR
jgi:hypothetical protein